MRPRVEKTASSSAHRACAYFSNSAGKMSVNVTCVDIKALPDIKMCLYLPPFSVNYILDAKGFDLSSIQFTKKANYTGEREENNWGFRKKLQKEVKPLQSKLLFPSSARVCFDLLCTITDIIVILLPLFDLLYKNPQNFFFKNRSIEMPLAHVQFPRRAGRETKVQVGVAFFSS